MGRPTQHNHPFLSFVGPAGPREGGSKTTRVRYAIPESHTRPQGRAGSGPASVAAAIAAGTRPDFPFPNPEAKTASADGTAPARVWESRTPPPTQTHKREGGPHQRAPLFSSPHTPAATTRAGSIHARPLSCPPTPAPAPQTHPQAHTPPHTHTAGRIPSRPHNTRHTGHSRKQSIPTQPHNPAAAQPQPHNTTHRRQPNRARTNRPAHTPTPHPQTHNTQANRQGT